MFCFKTRTPVSKQVSGIWRVQRESLWNKRWGCEGSSEQREDLRRRHWTRREFIFRRKKKFWYKIKSTRFDLSQCFRLSRQRELTNWRPSSSTWSLLLWSTSGWPDKTRTSPPAITSTDHSRYVFSEVLNDLNHFLVPRRQGGGLRNALLPSVRYIFINL